MGMAVYFQRFALLGENVQGKKHEQEHRAGLELLREGLVREYPQVFSGLCEEDLERELDRGEKGKPFLKHYPQIQFNLSHGKDMVVCGIDSSPLGVDVEAIRPVKPTIFRRVLTAGERDDLEKRKEMEGEEGGYRDFFRFWTLKESYAKAVGLGLAVDFTSFSFRLPAWEEVSFLCQNECSLCREKDGLPLKTLLFPGKREEEYRRKKGRHSGVFFMGEVEGDWETWHFYQTIIDREYVISCCLRR